MKWSRRVPPIKLGRANYARRIKAQQKAAGAALSAKRSNTALGELKGASKSMYESMSQKELHDMASTKRKGKPEHQSKFLNLCVQEKRRST